MACRTNFTKVNILEKFNNLVTHPNIFFLIRSKISYHDTFLVVPYAIRDLGYFDGRDPNEKPRMRLIFLCVTLGVLKNKF